MTRTTMRRAATALVLALSLVAAGGPDPADGAPFHGALPLGRPGLSETRTSTPVAPGVTHTRIVRGEASKHDGWIVDVAFLPDVEQAKALDRRLRAGGFKARIQRIDNRAPDDPAPGPLGYLVRVGHLTSEADAIALRDRLTGAGYTGLRVVYSGEDGGRTTGPWVVNVLEVAPEAFGGSVAPALGTAIVPGLERLTGIAARSGAIASVNGGYFVIQPADGSPGDLAGISVLDGALISEAVNGRTSLLLPEGDGAGASVRALSSGQLVTSADGSSRLIDGLNRKPGLVRGCGGTGGDIPTERPKHDFTCTDASELILFTPVFGPSTEPGDGVEAVLGAGGVVVELRSSRGGTIPPGGSVLSGTGDGADWLAAHARPGTTVTTATQVLADGTPIAIGNGLGVVNGGPRLLRAGQVDITAAAEGFSWEERPEFYYRFGVRRNPRTLAGVTAAGHLLLVTVDGRQPGWSVGAGFSESALLMRALGAVDSVNLDGGGSTAMTVGSELVTRPSDLTGERPIGDAVVIAAPSRGTPG